MFHPVTRVLTGVKCTLHEGRDEWLHIRLAISMFVLSYLLARPFSD